MTLQIISHVDERYQRVVICGQGPSWRDVTERRLTDAKEAGAAVIAVNGAVECFNGRPFTHWFTLDFSVDNRRRMAQRVRHVKYYAAVPGDYARRHEQHDGVRYLFRVSRETVGQGSFRERVRRQIVGGLSGDASAIYSGNSAFGALNLAYHMWPRKVVLLGVDGVGTTRWDGSQNFYLGHLPSLFIGSLRQLAARSISVVNGSPESNVACFPRLGYEAAIDWLLEEIDDMKPALIIGAAECVHDDIARLRDMLDEPLEDVFTIFAANDGGVLWGGRLDHWVSIHGDELPGREQRRSEAGGPNGYETWSRDGQVDHVVPKDYDVDGATSAGLATGVARYLGHRKAVWVGCPFTKQKYAVEHIHHGDGDWPYARTYVEALPSVVKKHPWFGPMVRSMSGFTKEKLGAPDKEWLAA